MEGITLQQAVPMIPKRSQGTPLPAPIKAGQEVPLPIKHAPAKEYDVVLAKAEQRRVEIVRDIANKYVLGNTRLSMFYKDMGGQYVTRYVNLLDGKVTYIPEPQLLSGQSNEGPEIRIDA